MADPIHKPVPVEFVVQLFSLIVAILFVHAIYVTVVRPNADAILREQSLRMKEDEEFVA